MAGGLFAINRAYYWELGAYDEQMAGWGGENLEMSFRIWQCGGTLETIPCSRVGHVFRSFHPYGLPAHTDTHGINTARMADVWMDEYAELFYLHRPDLRNNPKIGDVTHRKVLREKLQCKTFQWYLDNIYREKFVPVRDAYGYGRFQNLATGLCLDTLQREAEQSPLGVYQCHADLQATQYLILSLNHELRTEDDCAHAMYKRRNSLEADGSSRKVLMSGCRGKQREQKWVYLPGSQQLQHSETGLCLDAGAEAGADVLLRPCSSSAAQRWVIDYSEDNDFRISNDEEPNEQQKKLHRLRGQKKSLHRRKSRSLLSYSSSNSFPNLTIRRHHKKHKKRSRMNKTNKNKFILRLVRTLANNSEEHLEVDIHCNHRKLFPNNTFVRDLVTVLNDKNIKINEVINNGRLFERNKVTQLDTKPSENKEPKGPTKMDIQQQAPPEMDELKVVKKARKTKVKNSAMMQAPHAGRTEPRAHRIKIEDFVELTTVDTQLPKQVMKRKRKRPAAAAADESNELAEQLQKLPPVEEQINLPPASKETSVEDAPMEAGGGERRAWSYERDDQSMNEIVRRRNTSAATWRRQRLRLGARTDSDEEFDSEEPVSPRMRATEDPSTVKVVMRSNFTFNLGDEIFQWRRARDDEQPSDLSIPSSPRTPLPALAWLRGAVTRADASAEAEGGARGATRDATTNNSDDDSSASDSSSSSDK